MCGAGTSIDSKGLNPPSFRFSSAARYLAASSDTIFIHFSASLFCNEAYTLIAVVTMHTMRHSTLGAFFST